MTNHAQMMELLKQSQASGGSIVNFASAFGIISGLFLTPGLLLGSLVTLNSRLFLLSVFFAIAFGIGFLLQTFVGSRAKKHFFKEVKGAGISKHEAEEFYENVDWDNVFPKDG